jgi:hypothetical protein
MIAMAMLIAFSAPSSALTPAVADTVDRSSTIVLVQSSTGAGPVTGADTSNSGMRKETDIERGTLGKKSPFGADQPRSGDFAPDSSSSTASPPSPADTVDKMAGSNAPTGIGEKGTEQTRSTTERTGGPQPSASESTKSARAHGDRKSEEAAKELKSKKPDNQKDVANTGDRLDADRQLGSPPQLGPQGGSTADSGKAKHDEQPRAER